VVTGRLADKPNSWASYGPVLTYTAKGHRKVTTYYLHQVGLIAKCPVTKYMEKLGKVRKFDVDLTVVGHPVF